MKLVVNISGGESIADALEKVPEAIRAGALSGLQTGLEMIEHDAKVLCPVDTGELRGSINTRVEATETGAQGTVGSACEHAVYVEMGTGALGQATGQGRKARGAMYTLTHPGMAAQPYLYPAFRGNEDDVMAAVKAAIMEALE